MKIDKDILNNRQKIKEAEREMRANKKLASKKSDLTPAEREEHNKEFSLDVDKNKVREIIKENKIESNREAVENLKTSDSNTKEKEIKKYTRTQLKELQANNRIRRAKGLSPIIEKSVIDNLMKELDDDTSSDIDWTPSRSSSFSSGLSGAGFFLAIPVFLIITGIFYSLGITSLFSIVAIVLPVVLITFLVISGRNIVPVLASIIGFGVVLTVGYLVLEQVTEQLTLVEGSTVTSNATIQSFTSITSLTGGLLPLIIIGFVLIMVFNVFGRSSRYY